MSHLLPLPRDCSSNSHHSGEKLLPDVVLGPSLSGFGPRNLSLAGQRRGCEPLSRKGLTTVGGKLNWDILGGAKLIAFPVYVWPRGLT